MTSKVAVVLGQQLGRPSMITLRRWLSESGINADVASWHTVVKERDIKDSQVKHEAARVLDELAKIDDLKAVIVVGRYGVRLDSDLWRGGILKAHGHSGTLKLGADERRVNAIAMFDPYQYVRFVQEQNTRRAIEIENSCKLVLSRVLHMDDPVLMPDVLEQPRVYVNELVGLDTETNEGPTAAPEILGPYKLLLRRISKTAKLDPRAMTLKMVGLSDGRLSFNGVDFGPDAEPIAYNLPFDAIVTGDWRPRWHDPKMGAHLLGEKDTEMKSLGMRWLGRPLMHYDEAAGTDREPSYCVADSMTHRDLLAEFYKRASPGIRNVYDNIERPMFRLFCRWSMEGVFDLDRVAAEALYAKQLEEIATLTKRIAYLTGGKITNPDSTDQKAAYVFGWSKELHPDEKPSVDDKSLATKMHVRGVPEIRERARLKKQASTYLGAWLDWPFEKLGCLWRPTGAWTGRPSVTALQLHNVPPDLRKYLTPAKGKRLKSLDNSQLEIRVAAHVSQDRNMIRLLRGEMPGYEDGDLHRWTTDKISKAVGRPVPRTFGKVGNFSTLYLGSEAAIYMQGAKYGISADELRPVAHTIHEVLMGLYVDYFRWANKVASLSRIPGLFGAVLIPPPHPDESYRAREKANAPIQRGAVDIVKLQTLALENAGFRTVHQIHDEVIIEIDEADDTPELDVEVKRIMAGAVVLDVPLKVDSKLWGV